MKSKIKDAIMGVVVGDALGVPVEFMSRSELLKNPVKGMLAYGTHYQPAGTWSDDSSMMLATLDSLSNGYDLDDMMVKFALWVEEGEYTPYGEVFDIGNTCRRAIDKYFVTGDIKSCGCMRESDNGNGSLMRIIPVCLYAYEKQKNEGLSDDEAIVMVHDASALTHAHLRSRIACGLYYFMVRSILDNSGNLNECLQSGMDMGFGYYEESEYDIKELCHYNRLRNLEKFAGIEEADIISSGYVVTSLEAAVWSLINTDCYKEAMLKAVNLGGDTDTVAAIAGGLAGLYYGYESIPIEWLNVIAERECIEKLVSTVCVDMGDYVELLKENGLIEYVGQMENAGGLRCTDIEGNDIIYISITLEENHEKWARVNLDFRDFPNRVVKSNFRLLK